MLALASVELTAVSRAVAALWLSGEATPGRLKVAVKRLVGVGACN